MRNISFFNSLLWLWWMMFVRAAGVGVPQALGKYLRQKNQYQKLTSDARATSVNKYFLEGVNETFVRDALKNS